MIWSPSWSRRTHNLYTGRVRKLWKHKIYFRRNKWPSTILNGSFSVTKLFSPKEITDCSRNLFQKVMFFLSYDAVLNEFCVMCSSSQGPWTGGAAERPGDASRTKSAGGAKTTPRGVQQDGERQEHTDRAADQPVRNTHIIKHKQFLCFTYLFESIKVWNAKRQVRCGLELD